MPFNKNVYLWNKWLQTNYSRLFHCFMQTTTCLFHSKSFVTLASAIKRILPSTPSVLIEVLCQRIPYHKCHACKEYLHEQQVVGELLFVRWSAQHQQQANQREIVGRNNAILVLIPFDQPKHSEQFDKHFARQPQVGVAKLCLARLEQAGLFV